MTNYKNNQAKDLIEELGWSLVEAPDWDMENKAYYVVGPKSGNSNIYFAALTRTGKWILYPQQINRILNDDYIPESIKLGVQAFQLVAKL